MLTPGSLANNMKAFIESTNQLKQEDANKAIDTYCKSMEQAIFEAIKSITITIPPAAISVVGSSTAQANVAPIVLENVVS